MSGIVCRVLRQAFAEVPKRLPKEKTRFRSVIPAGLFLPGPVTPRPTPIGVFKTRMV